MPEQTDNSIPAETQALDQMTVSKEPKKTKKAKEEQEVDLVDIYYFAQPNLVAGVAGKQISKVYANGHYCYALSEPSNELYSWGMGSNYVLGTRDDENAFEPVQVHPKQFHENKVKEVGLGI